MAVGHVRPEGRDRLGARPEMVVDDVEDHAQALAMRRLDQPREPVRPAVGGMRRVRVEAVVAPPALPGEGRDRHQLDRRDAQLAQLGQEGHDSVERPLRRERSDVELVDRRAPRARGRAGRPEAARRLVTGPRSPGAGSASTDRAAPGPRRGRTGSRRPGSPEGRRRRPRSPRPRARDSRRRCGRRRSAHSATRRGTGRFRPAPGSHRVCCPARTQAASTPPRRALPAASTRRGRLRDRSQRRSPRPRRRKTRPRCRRTRRGAGAR